MLLVILCRNNGIYTISSNSSNCIESIEYPNNDFYLGVQWHPEKNIDTDINSIKIFKRLIKSATKND